jgi:hypothetical protein
LGIFGRVAHGSALRKTTSAPNVPVASWLGGQGRRRAQSKAGPLEMNGTEEYMIKRFAKLQSRLDRHLLIMCGLIISQIGVLIAIIGILVGRI